MDREVLSELDTELIERLRVLGDANDYQGYLDLLNKALEQVEVQENNEPMVRLEGALSSDIYIDLTDLKISVPNDQRLFLRKDIMERLNHAQAGLPSGYHLLIRDAFRSEAVVRALYERYVALAQEKGLSAHDADLKVRNILAMPDDPVPPGHMTGGALDVILAHDNHERVPLTVDETVIPRDRQMFTFCPDLPQEVLRERRVLYDAMTNVGFHNYFREYWHYSYGDPYWAVRRKNKVAFYGIPPDSVFDYSHARNSSFS